MADYTKTAWINDDGSGTVGTLITAERLNNIESGVQDAAQHNKSGTLATRPAAAAENKGWLWYATDTGTFAMSDGSSWLASPVPQVRVTNSAVQSIPNSTLTALTFDTETFDSGTPSNNMHDTGSNTSRLTCRVAGLYQITGLVEFATSATGVRIAALKLNGTISLPGGTVSVQSSSGTPSITQITTSYRLAVSDYIELIVWQNSGGSLNTYVGDTGVTGIDVRPSFAAVFVSV